MEETAARYTGVLDVNEAYFRETWRDNPRIRRATRLLALLPVAGFLAGGWMWAVRGRLSMGFLVTAALFLAFDLALPRLALRQYLLQYQKFHADGQRRVTLLADGVETELMKYGETVFHPYADFERLEEDRLCWYLSRPGQRVVIPKSVGDGAQVRAFLEERLAAAKETSALPREAEQHG